GRGPTRAEVDSAKTAVVARTVASLDDLGGFGGLADQLNFYNHYLGDPSRIDDDLRRTAEVTPGRVQRFAARQLDPARRVVVEVVPGPKMPVDDPPAPPEPEPAAASSTTGGGPDADAARPPSGEPWRNAVPSAGPTPTTPVPPVRRFTLANGLAVWLVESHRLPMVSASLVSRLGSASDPPDRPGVVDLATSALDGGTTGRDALGLSRELEAAGATLGNDTGKDGTWLAATSLTGHAPATLAIMADVARNPTFPADEVDRVRDAAIVALRQDRDDADTIAESVGVREVFGAGHPYGHRTVGTEDGLRAATVDDLRRAHDRAFTPATTALVLAGDLDEAAAKTLAEGAFGSWTAGPPGGPAGGPPPPSPPAGTPDRVVIVDRPGATQTSLFLAAPGLAQADPDYEPLLVTNRVFGGGFSSRLNANLRETRGYTYGAYSSVGNSRGVGLVSIAMDVQTPTTADAVRETIREVDTLTASGVTADELARAKQWLSGSLPSLFATRTKTVGTLRTLYLDDLPVDYYQTRPARLAHLTTADVAAVAARRFPSGAFTVVAVGDRSAIEGPLRALRLGSVSVASP
ncbi:MAG TPA: insulinase family protein, partial [Acidimicrobiia bacterium]|nr:insulinase family protein [Acidimicrobiia bacterium]